MFQAEPLVARFHRTGGGKVYTPSKVSRSPVKIPLFPLAGGRQDVDESFRISID
jgi:hypothetical protein